jgi:hypothetical protein
VIVAYVDGKRTVFDADDADVQGDLQMIKADGGEFYLFENNEDAGEAARAYWEDMAYNDPKEFTCMVGEETLIQWGLGQWAGPGSTQVQSLQEWLDLWLSIPEEHFASYDGNEGEFECKHPDWDEFTVAYRHN